LQLYTNAKLKPKKIRIRLKRLNVKYLINSFVFNYKRPLLLKEGIILQLHINKKLKPKKIKIGLKKLNIKFIIKG
jgi:hypothetical protein